MRQANKEIICERHVIPKLEDILTELHRAKYSSKIDLTERYHQIKLAENSSHITTFATHEGFHRYKRLIYGISSAFESFQKQIEIVISGCQKAKKISGNILIWGNSLEDHSNNLEKVFQLAHEHGVNLQPPNSYSTVMYSLPNESHQIQLKLTQLAIYKFPKAFDSSAKVGRRAIKQLQNL